MSSKPAARGQWMIWGILTTFFLAAVVGYTLQLMVFRTGVVSQVIGSVAGTFLGAFLLSLAGDFYLRRRLNEEAVRQGVRNAVSETFGFMSPDQPEQLQAAVRDLASAEQFLRSSRRRLIFEWHDKPNIVRITIVNTDTGHNLSVTPYRPQFELWVYGSVSGFNSGFERYSFHCPQSGISVDERGLALEPYLQTKGPRVFLDQARLLANALPSNVGVGQGNDYVASREVYLYRQGIDVVPLMHGIFEMTFVLELAGSALPDLAVSAFQPQSADGLMEWNIVAATGPNVSHTWRNVTPGQATLVSWSLAPAGSTESLYKPTIEAAEHTDD